MWGQKAPITDTTVSAYGNLPTLKTYSVSSSSLTSDDTSWFKIDGNNVDEKTYRKFGETIGVYDQCKPCVMLSFDTSERLLHKWIAYSECRIGYWIEYYPGGNVKVVGHYRENETANWNNLLERGYCIKDGTWTYFNEKGNVTRTEIWEKGKRIKTITVRKS